MSFYYTKISLFLFSLIPMIYWKYQFLKTVESHWGFIYYRKLLNCQRKFRIWVFLAGIWKKLLPFSESVPLTFSICEASCKIKKILTFSTKNALFGYYWARIRKKPLSYLKSTPSNLPNCKVWCKIRILKFETKNA